MRVSNLVGALRKGRAGARERHWPQVDTLRRRVLQQPRILEDQSQELIILARTATLDTAETADAARILQDLKYLVTRVEAVLLRRSRERFRGWIANSLKIGAGALHRYTKQYGEARQQLARTLDAEGKEVVDPLLAVGAKAAFWGGLW